MDAKTVQRMLFLYRAVEDGWTVRKTSGSCFEFSKPLHNVTQEMLADEFPILFLREYSNIDSFFAFLRRKRDQLLQ